MAYPCIPSYSRDWEVGELFESGKMRLRWAEITPLHSSLGNKNETPSQKKKRIQYFYFAKSWHVQMKYTFLLWYIYKENLLKTLVFMWSAAVALHNVLYYGVAAWCREKSMNFGDRLSGVTALPPAGSVTTAQPCPGCFSCQMQMEYLPSRVMMRIEQAVLSIEYGV